ncbi:hypothetical protein KC345_g1403 [Hortaea werneckii]|nr:hypothetical protein KC345_g1403 [Hortaea werneckii]
MFPFFHHHHPLLSLLLPSLLLLSPRLVHSLPITTTVITTKTLTTTTVPSPHPQQPQPQPSHQAQNDNNSDNDFLAHALISADRLTEHWYNASTGLWQDLWSNSGNFVTTLARLGQVVDERQDADAGAKGWRDSVGGFLEREFEVTERGTEGGQGWLREFFDDGGWWALAWIQVYDLTNDARYLNTAEKIFDDLTTGLNATCGGQWWDKAHTASNTINNALYISVAAHLANRVPTTSSSSSSSSKPPETYRAAARAHLQWLRYQNLLTHNGTYVDGLDLTTCKPTGAVFTYNQGVMIGALVEMSRFPTTTTNSAEDHNEEEEAASLLSQAETLANGTLHSLVDSAGILTETAFAPSFPNLDLVAAQFKGVFVRHLASLYAVRPQREEYREFLARNARSVWEKDRVSGGEDEGLLGAAWQGPVESVSSAAQGSGLDCLVAAAGLGE